MRKIIFYGDSNTYGFDPRDFFRGRFDDDIIWTNIVKAALEGQWEVVSEGMNGRRLPLNEAGMKYIERLLDGLSEDDVFAIMLGTNDILESAVPDANKPLVRMENLLKWIFARALHPRILIIAPPYVGSNGDPELKEYHEECIRMNKGFLELAAKYGVEAVDAADWNVPLTFDGVHFSEKGHRVFADNMLLPFGSLPFG